MWWRSLFFYGAFFGTLLFLIPSIVWGLCASVSRLFGGKVPYVPFALTGLALVLVLWAALVYGHYVGRFKLEVNRVEFRSPEVPAAFDGFRIVQISDLHVDSFDGHDAVLQRIVDTVNAQDADIVLFTGDMTTSDMQDILSHEPALKRIGSRGGVMSVLGNHDFFLSCPQYTTVEQHCAAADTLAAYERDVLGWNVLRNSSCILRRGGDSIAVAGVDNIAGRQGFRTIQKGDLGKAMEGLDGVFTVLMSHDPGHWKAEVLPRSHAQITLSGHTHAGQVRLFGWSPSHLAFDECDGRYDFAGGSAPRMLYVNAGLGCTSRMRIACPSEVTVVTLRRSPA